MYSSNMGALKGSNVSSDRRQWQKVFNALTHLLRRQQIQIESLAKERQFLEDRIKLQYGRWVFDVNQLQDQISLMNRDFTGEEMKCNFEAAKWDLMVGQKQREAFIYKTKLYNAASELADFRVWFGHLSHNCCETKVCTISSCRCILWISSSQLSMHLQNDSEMLALLSERNFVWNQYKKRESDLTNRLKIKSTEVEHANEKIQELLTTMEQLKSSNVEKDIAILKLKTDMAELEAASTKKSDEISRLSNKLELLRKAGSNSDGTEGDKNRGTDSRNTIPKKESHPSQVFQKGCRSSKRKSVDTILISETPKLFKSTFKVPKLKNSFPCVI
ncbi:hypothetical protein ACSBR2_000226 [Camellia fascicularis]